MKHSKGRGHWEACGVGLEMGKGSKKKRDCLKTRVRIKTERSREYVGGGGRGMV